MGLLDPLPDDSPWYRDHKFLANKTYEMAARIAELTAECNTLTALLTAGNLGLNAPLSVMPVQSDHGDVHDILVCRSNGDSVTVTELKRVFRAVTGRELEDREIPLDWFAEEDRI